MEKNGLPNGCTSSLDMEATGTRQCHMESKVYTTIYLQEVVNYLANTIS